MTDSSIEWFQNKLTELENSENKKELLTELKTFVLNSDKRVIHDLTSKTSLTPIFNCLESTDPQEIDLLCILLIHLLIDYSGDKLLQNYGAQVQKGLTHQSNKVKDIILKVMNKNLNESALEILVKNHQDILHSIVPCLGSAETPAAEAAKSLLIKIKNTPTGVAVLYSPAVVENMKVIMNSTDVGKTRVFEVFIAASVVSPENLAKTISCGMMDLILAELSSKDILMQLNALEMLSSLAHSDHGLDYLQEKNIVKNLIDRLAKINRDHSSSSVGNLLLPGLIEFIGTLVTQKPDYFINKYPEIMELLLSALDSTDEVVLGVIISSLGKIGSTPAGRTQLNKYESKTLLIFKKIGTILKTKNELTVSVLSSLGELIKEIKNEPALNQIAKTWFESVNPSAMDTNFSVAKLPFVEYRFASFTLYKAIATQDWGVEKICQHPGLIEFLTDRSNEFNRECKYLKFEIVNLLVHSSVTEGIVGPQVMANLKKFVKEGPFYVPPKVDTATEGAV